MHSLTLGLKTYAQEDTVSELYQAVAAGVALRFNAQRPELRESSGVKHIAGYASVFGRKSRNLGGFVEQIDRRAFDQAEMDGWPDVICRYNHDDNYLLGTTRGNTLTLRTDDTGLWYDVIPPTFRQDIVELCARGDVTQSSFAFRVPDQGDYWERSGPGGMPLRIVTNTELVDVAPVNTPAYAEATASARAFDDDLIVSLARLKECSPAEVRSYLNEAGNVAKFFKRSDRPSESRNEEPEVDTTAETDEQRATIKKRGELPDSVFAYIEPGHDSEKVDGRTPDKYRHFPLIDESHVRNALSQAPKSPFGAKAMPKIKAAAKKFGIKVDEQNSLIDAALAEYRAELDAAVEEETDEERKAKANYADLETCGDCGAQGQYGKHCANCGSAMNGDAPAGKYCTQCGGKLSGKRDEHTCDLETREGDEAEERKDGDVLPEAPGEDQTAAAEGEENEGTEAEDDEDEDKKESKRAAIEAEHQEMLDRLLRHQVHDSDLYDELED